MTRDMKGTKPGANLVTRHTSRHVRTSIKRGKRLKDGNSVDVDLSLAEGVLCVFQDASDVILGLNAKANPPAHVRQLPSVPERVSSASLFRYARRAEPSSNSLNSPRSRADMPSSAAARRVLSFVASSTSRFSTRRSPSRITSL